MNTIKNTIKNSKKNYLTQTQQYLINKGIKRIFHKTLGPFQDYGTPVYDILAHPLKKALAYVLILILLAFILRKLKLLKFIIRINYIYIYIIGLIIVMFVLYINQLHTNDNIIYLSKKFPENATLYDYGKHKPKYTIIKIFLSTLLSIVISDFIKFNFTNVEGKNIFSNNSHKIAAAASALSLA